MDSILKRLLHLGIDMMRGIVLVKRAHASLLLIGPSVDQSIQLKTKLRRRLALFLPLIPVTLVLIAQPISAAAVDVAASAASATSEIFIKRGTDLLADGAGAKIGAVTPGTTAHLLSQQGSTAKIQIEGWSITGAPSVVFTAIGQRIMEARLTASGQSTRTVVKKSKDDYGSIWEQVRFTGEVPKDSIAPDVASIWDGAHQIYSKACSACHALHHPDEFTANQWPNILKVMTKRAALSDEQTELITEYLQTHAKGSHSPL